MYPFINFIYFQVEKGERDEGRLGGERKLSSLFLFTLQLPVTTLTGTVNLGLLWWDPAIS